MFSITATGTANEAIGAFAQQAATAGLPSAFTDAINLQLSTLPPEAKVVVQCDAKLGWGEAQTKGQLTLNLTIDVATGRHPSEAQLDTGPEAAPAA